VLGGEARRRDQITDYRRATLHWRKFMKNVLRSLITLTIVSFAMFPFASVYAAAQNDTKPQAKAPETAQEHYAMADKYTKEAAELQGEIAQHRAMLADYSKGVAKLPKATGENSYIKNMRLHCEKYIKAAESLAAEDTELAKFHTLRAKELEGK
jgi:hypothetical protein